MNLFIVPIVDQRQLWWIMKGKFIFIKCFSNFLLNSLNKYKFWNFFFFVLIHFLLKNLLMISYEYLKWYNFILFQDHDFFQHLEMYMRSEHPPLCGRDHLSFRSYYFPVKVTMFFQCFYQQLNNIFLLNCYQHAN